MQTFLPYPSYAESARCLDYRRLGKQRVEAYQILRTLLGESQGWKNHPAVRMWAGNEYQLCLYACAICREWVARGYKDTVNEKLVALYVKHKLHEKTPVEPSWLYNDLFHASHRSNLLRKDPVYYGQFGWSESPDMPYVWPSKEDVAT